MVPLRALAHEGGKESGMQPQGQGAWCVAEAIRETIKSERGKTEGLIGTLKTDQDGVQQTPGTSVADAGDGRSRVSPLLQSEQAEAEYRTRQPDEETRQRG